MCPVFISGWSMVMSSRSKCYLPNSWLCLFWLQTCLYHPAYLCHVVWSIWLDITWTSTLCPDGTSSSSCHTSQTVNWRRRNYRNSVLPRGRYSQKLVSFLGNLMCTCISQFTTSGGVQLVIFVSIHRPFWNLESALYLGVQTTVGMKTHQTCVLIYTLYSCMYAFYTH